MFAATVAVARKPPFSSICSYGAVKVAIESYAILSPQKLRAK